MGWRLAAGGGQALRYATARYLCCPAAPLDRRADLQLVGRAAPVEPRLRIPSRVERGAHLCRHEPPGAATPDPLTGNRRTFQPGWMTFQTVSDSSHGI